VRQLANDLLTAPALAIGNENLQRRRRRRRPLAAAAAGRGEQPALQSRPFPQVAPTSTIPVWDGREWALRRHAGAAPRRHRPGRRSPQAAELNDWRERLFDLYEGMPPPETVFRLGSIPLARLTHHDGLAVGVSRDGPPGYHLAPRDADRAWPVG
jgi:hypothetical protein